MKKFPQAKYWNPETLKSSLEIALKERVKNDLDIIPFEKWKR